MAVDFVPCLDNFKAIKALESRKHMEHRERHCPSPSPRCLIPLPSGYKVPVPWPKSRDMVSLILFQGLLIILFFLEDFLVYCVCMCFPLKLRLTVLVILGKFCVRLVGNWW